MRPRIDPSWRDLAILALIGAGCWLVAIAFALLIFGWP